MCGTEKNFNIHDFVANFSKLPVSLVYGFDDPNDQISILKQLVLQYIFEHEPTRKVLKFTRPPAPWMNDPEVTTAKKQLPSRDASHADGNVCSASMYISAKNTYKKSLRLKKASFIKKALSSKNPKEAWETVSRIRNPPKKRIKQDPNEIFPEKWKIARVCPVPKIDNPVKEKDFRPIFILPVLSKIYEKVILLQLSEHIESTSRIYNNTQSGFRKGHST